MAKGNRRGEYEEKFKAELDGTIYTREDEVGVYVELRKDGMAEVGAIEALSSFGPKELAAIARFRRLYGHYFEEDDEKTSDITVTISADVDEAVSGFKRLQRELRKTSQEAREMEQAYKDVEQAIISDKIVSINEMRDVQGEPGNYDVSDYMTGLFNGLELASATLERREPNYRLKPFKKVDLSDVSTKELHEELAKREGVEEYVIAPHGECAKLHVDKGNYGGTEYIEGPARILVNKD